MFPNTLHFMLPVANGKGGGERREKGDKGKERERKW